MGGIRRAAFLSNPHEAGNPFSGILYPELFTTNKQLRKWGFSIENAYQSTHSF
jgi:hypothetical protein